MSITDAPRFPLSRRAVLAGGVLTATALAIRPARATPETMRAAIRQIVGAVDLCGMDIVEVSPPYDHAATTAMAANRAALEAISALAVRRQAGKPVRWTGQWTPRGDRPASPD